MLNPQLQYTGPQLKKIYINTEVKNVTQPADLYVLLLGLFIVCSFSTTVQSSFLYIFFSQHECLLIFYYYYQFSWAKKSQILKCKAYKTPTMCQSLIANRLFFFTPETKDTEFMALVSSIIYNFWQCVSVWGSPT